MNGILNSGFLGSHACQIRDNLILTFQQYLKLLQSVKCQDPSAFKKKGKYESSPLTRTGEVCSVHNPPTTRDTSSPKHRHRN